MSDDPICLVPARSSLLRHAATMFVLAVFTGAMVVVVFDWELDRMLLGAACGAVIWGALSYVMDVRREVPPRGEELLPAPPGAEIHASRGFRPRLLLIFPFCVALAWFADRFDSGGALVPGQFAGSAAAHLIGAIAVGRWQRDHVGAVLVRYEGVEDPMLYVDL